MMLDNFKHHSGTIPPSPVAYLNHIRKEMRLIFTFLSSLTSIYLLLIFIRILLTWFNGLNFGKPGEILCVITDPYLGWFRRLGLQVGGFLDLSPIVAMAVLSVLNSVFMRLANFGSVSAGIIFALLLGSLWSAAAFILGFIAVILALRLFAFLTNRNIFSPFWRVIDAISNPIIYKTSKILFPARNVNLKTEIIATLAVFGGIWLFGGIIIRIASLILTRLPI
ncbi:MAG: YggT family protein [Treponema sp.]|jgi:YggT family protein|nr:YggT family protein [Treponema sp.]